MNEIDVKKVVNDEIKKFINDSLDKEMKKIIHNNNSATHDEIISSIRNAFDSVYKILWQKKEFWQAGIK